MPRLAAPAEMRLVLCVRVFSRIGSFVEVCVNLLCRVFSRNWHNIMYVRKISHTRANNTVPAWNRHGQSSDMLIGEVGLFKPAAGCCTCGGYTSISASALFCYIFM